MPKKKIKETDLILAEVKMIQGIKQYFFLLQMPTTRVQHS